MTPLHLTAESGHVKIVNYLCDKGADTNIQDKEGVNPNFKLPLFKKIAQLLFESNSLSAFKFQRSWIASCM